MLQLLSSPLAAAQAEAWLEGLLLLLALAGPAVVLNNALLRRHLWCCVAYCALHSQKREKINQAWKEGALHPPLSSRLAGKAGAAQEEPLLLLWKASAVGQHHATFARLCVSEYMCSQNVLQLDVSFRPRHLWPAGWAGKEEQAPSALAAAQVDTGLEGHVQ